MTSNMANTPAKSKQFSITILGHCQAEIKFRSNLCYSSLTVYQDDAAHKAIRITDLSFHIYGETAVKHWLIGGRSTSSCF